MRGLSVVVPSRNDSTLVACFEAVRRSEHELRLIVIEDGLKLDWLPREDFMPAIGHNPHLPFVFARNVNLGMKLAVADDVILLNDDALLETPNGFTAMQRIAEEHPEYGVIAAATNVANNPAQMRRAGAELRDAGKAVAFVCVLIPRRTIDLVGLLDERFAGEIDGEMIYGGEDTDYCYRVRKAGLKIGVFDGCFVDHASLPSTFRPDGKGLPINATRQRFREIHGVEMEIA